MVARVLAFSVAGRPGRGLRGPRNVDRASGPGRLRPRPARSRGQRV